MNLVIKNQNYRIIDSLNTDIIKTLTGEFTIEEAQQNLVNLIYNKVIIDITAIKNYYDINSVITFLRGFDASKIVLLLNDSEVINGSGFLGHLVENGIYNFTRNAAGITYLLDNPNNYEAVMQYVKPTTETVPIMPFYNAGIQDMSQNVTMSHAIPQQSAPENIYVPDEMPKPIKGNRNQKIIGLQNLTDHAGSTTLAYIMIKQLKLNYHVKGIEMNKQDFIYFRDSDLALCTSVDDFKLKLKEFAAADAIIVDLNDFDASEFCDEILYLVDPGIIKLTKLLKRDSNVITKVRNGKVVLNRSSIKQEEISNFEYESKFKVFFNMPNISDRKARIQVVDALLYQLGFSKQNPSNFGIFGGIFQKN